MAKQKKSVGRLRFIFVQYVYEGVYHVDFFLGQYSLRDIERIVRREKGLEPGSEVNVAAFYLTQKEAFILASVLEQGGNDLLVKIMRLAAENYSSL
jgi:hypothetical protein